MLIVCELRVWCHVRGVFTIQAELPAGVGVGAAVAADVFWCKKAQLCGWVSGWLVGFVSALISLRTFVAEMSIPSGMDACISYIISLGYV